MTHTVAGQTIELELPRLAIRYDLAVSASTGRAHEQTARRVVAAALLLCAPSAMRKSPLRYTGDVLQFGGDAIEFLLERGATWAEIIAAGNAALQLCIDAIATEEDHKRARGNSEAPPGPDSGSGGGSPAGGGA